MPVREYRCTSPICLDYGQVFEVIQKISDPAPKCPECLCQTEALASRFATPWTGTLDRFDKKGCETQNPTDGGHIAYRIRSSRNPDGTPEAVRITTRQEQRDYCRAEGLTDPTDINPNLEGSSDGTWGNTSGFSGQWASASLDQQKFVPTFRTIVDGIALKPEVTL